MQINFILVATLLLNIIFTSLNCLAQDSESKTVNHVLWINIPDLSKEGIDNSVCRNLDFIAKKGYSNYSISKEKEPYKDLLFSCNGENIMQALERNNSEVKTAAFVADKALYKSLKDLGIDNLKIGSSDVALTEWAYESLRDERPNFMFVNFSGIQEIVKRGNSSDSEAYKRAVLEIDVMISGIFKGLIESKIYASAAIVISSVSSEYGSENGILLMQADDIIAAASTSSVEINAGAIMPSLNELIGGIPGFKCSETSILNSIN